jgi:hypothetical protein
MRSFVSVPLCAVSAKLWVIIILQPKPDYYPELRRGGTELRRVLPLCISVLSPRNSVSQYPQAVFSGGRFCVPGSLSGRPVPN